MESLLEEKGIPYVTSGKEVTDGFIGLSCPFCEDKGQHLGWNLEKDFFTCWKCGWHPTEQVIRLLTGLSYYHVKLLLQEHSEHFYIENNKVKSEYKEIEWIQEPFTEFEVQYLQKRNFNPEYLYDKYKVSSGGIYGEYAYRIKIPYFVDGKVITFTSRTVVPNKEPRYKTFSGVNTKDFLFNYDNLDHCILVEGAFDAMRMGKGFYAISGSELTPMQFQYLSNKKQIDILYDSDKASQERAKKTANDISSFGIKTRIITLDKGKDCADLTDDEAEKVRNFIFGR
jgi:DNA primase